MIPGFLNVLLNNLVINSKQCRNHFNSNKMVYCPQFRFIAIVSESCHPGKVEFSVLSIVWNKRRLCPKISDMTQSTFIALIFLSNQEKCLFSFLFYFNIHFPLEQRPLTRRSLFLVLYETSVRFHSDSTGSYSGILGTTSMWETKVFKMPFLPTGHSSQALTKHIENKPTLLPTCLMVHVSESALDHPESIGTAIASI